MRRRLIGGFVAVALLSLTGTAAARVVFDPDTSTGSVGKGDVQASLHWNNRTLQANASDVAFGQVVRQDAYVSWGCLNTVTGAQSGGHYTTSWVGRYLLASTPILNRRGRVKGFTFNGLVVGDPTVLSYTVDPPGGESLINTCPDGPWQLVQGAYAAPSPPVSSLQVSGDGGSSWTALRNCARARRSAVRGHRHTRTASPAHLRQRGGKAGASSRRPASARSCW